MLKLLVHGLGAWFAIEAASGRYPRPVAVGLTMLVSRLGAPATALAMAGYGVKWLKDAGAFENWQAARERPRRAASAKPRHRRRPRPATRNG
ncbi:conserved hypothetical protein [Hyphomicrobiales bacterium]|nr:conserved hypothetical protein [Hyphomicrobiales bacterium]CAH1701324.1 conserved hypothetical protein [Hyphomicrobiales bacterium]CAI0345284.1 conserved hypothetical protein [Hyphomicrobiales bacterium]